jgi:hypothetical protein
MHPLLPKCPACAQHVWVGLPDLDAKKEGISLAPVSAQKERRTIFQMCSAMQQFQRLPC